MELSLITPDAPLSIPVIVRAVVVALAISVALHTGSALANQACNQLECSSSSDFTNPGKFVKCHREYGVGKRFSRGVLLLPRGGGGGGGRGGRGRGGRGKVFHDRRAGTSSQSPPSTSHPSSQPPPPAPQPHPPPAPRPPAQGPGLSHSQTFIFDQPIFGHDMNRHLTPAEMAHVKRLKYFFDLGERHGWGEKVPPTFANKYFGDEAEHIKAVGPPELHTIEDRYIYFLGRMYAGSTPIPIDYVAHYFYELGQKHQFGDKAVPDAIVEKLYAPLRGHDGYVTEQEHDIVSHIPLSAIANNFYNVGNMVPRRPYSHDLLKLYYDHLNNAARAHFAAHQPPPLHNFLHSLLPSLIPPPAPPPPFPSPGYSPIPFMLQAYLHVLRGFNHPQA